MAMVERTLRLGRVNKRPANHRLIGSKVPNPMNNPSFRLTSHNTQTLSTLLVGAAVWTAPWNTAVRAADADAATVAARVQKFYDQTKTVGATFRQTYYHQLYDRYDRSRGRVSFKKDGKMRWDYAKPNGKVIVSNGKKLQIYDPGSAGETPQLFERNLDEHQMPQAFGFLTGTGELARDFDLRLLDTRKLRIKNGHVLELRPKEATPHYDRILFYVDARPGRAGIVHRVLIVDPAGNRNRFDFGQMKFNAPVPDQRFRYKAPPGTRRIRP